ncbi:TIGR04076 family protein [Chloroflexota bacterium]
MSQSKVKVTVHSITKGECDVEHKVGDSWLIESGLTPDGMCAPAYHTMYSVIRHFQDGGEYSRDEDKDVKLVACPDTKHVVIFEVRRMQ